MPVFFRKEIARAGSYVQGGVNFRITPGEIRQLHSTYMAGLVPRGYRAPLLLEHSDPAAGDGGPTQLSALAALGMADKTRQQKANEIRNTVGHMIRTEIDPAKGRLYGVFQVDHEDDAKLISKMRFVSPEIRAKWEDGKGCRHTAVVSHVALTHKPIVMDQEPGFRQLSDGSAVVGRVRLSLSEYAVKVKDKPIQLSRKDDDTEYGGSDESDGEAQFTPDAGGQGVGGDPMEAMGMGAGGAVMPPEPMASVEPENPFAPADADAEAKAQQMLSGLISYLEVLGLPLPPDTTPENLVERLYVSAATKIKNEELAQAQQSKAESEAASAGGSQSPIEERQPIVQYSAESRHRKAIESMSRRGQVTPAMRETLESLLGSVQLSDDGSPLVSLDGVLAAIESSTPSGMAELVRQFSGDQAAEPDHPSGKQFFSDTPAGDFIMSPDDPRAAEAANLILRQ